MEEKKPYKRSPEYRRDAIRAAQDLGYGDEVISKIREAKNDYQISCIMKMARFDAINRGRR